MMARVPFTAAKAVADKLEADWRAAGEAVKALVPSRLANGLTPDHIKASPEWKAAKAEYEKRFAAMRRFNAIYTKMYAAELKAERDARRRA